MSNVSVIQRMHDILSSFAEQAISPHEFERSFGFHMDALERLDLFAIHRARELTAAAVRAPFFDGEEEFGSPADQQAAIEELRSFISSLPV